MKNNDIKLQLKEHGVITNRALVPNIPLPFEEVITDVLRIKPVEKPEDKPRREPRKRLKPAQKSGSL